MSASTSRAPACDSRRAAALPMAPAAPVIRAVLPVSVIFWPRPLTFLSMPQVLDRPGRITRKAEPQILVRQSARTLTVLRSQT